MTKLRTPLATDRISAELAEAIATLFPPALAPGMPASPDAARRDEYVGIFTEAAEKILSLVDDGYASEVVINRLLLACLASQQHANTSFEALERLRKEMKTTSTLLARTKKAGPSKNAGKIVSHHANLLWTAKPWLRETDHGTAAEIVDKVNADLEKGDLKRLSVSAITKRVGRIPRTSG